MSNRAKGQMESDQASNKLQTAAGAAIGGLMLLAGEANRDDDREDDELQHYLKGTIGLGYQDIPVTTNRTANGSDNFTNNSSTNHYCLNAGLKLALFNNKFVSFRLDPFFIYGINASSGTSGNHTSFGSGTSVCFGRKFKFLVKGEYVQRSGDMSTDYAIYGIDNKGETAYNYTTLKYGVGFYLGLGGHDHYAEIGAFKENLSFLSPNKKDVYSFEVKASFEVLTFTAQYSPNYPPAGNIKYPLNYKNEKHEYLYLSIYVPFTIF